MDKVNLADRFELIGDYWHPRIVGTLNDSHVKLAKLSGEFVWHHHEAEDEMFLVVQGELTIRLRDRELTLGPGEFCIVPRGVEHLPVAKDEAHVLLIEPRTTLNTGNVRNDLTRTEIETI